MGLMSDICVPDSISAWIAMDVVSSGPGWQNSCGQPYATWIQICSNTNLQASDAFILIELQWWHLALKSMAKKTESFTDVLCHFALLRNFFSRFDRRTSCVIGVPVMRLFPKSKAVIITRLMIVRKRRLSSPVGIARRSTSAGRHCWRPFCLGSVSTQESNEPGHEYISTWELGTDFTDRQANNGQLFYLPDDWRYFEKKYWC